MVDFMRFQRPVDGTGFADGIRDAIGGILMSRAQRNMGGPNEQRAMDQLARMDPRRAGQVGAIFEQRQQQKDQIKQREMELTGKIATHWGTAKDKAGFIDSAIQSLSMYQDDPAAAEVIKDLTELRSMPPEQIDGIMGQLQAQFGAPTKQVNQQFGAQQTVKDEQGNLFFATQKRNPSTGQVESVLSPIGNGPAQPVGQVQVTGQFGLTAGENVNQKGAETSANVNAKANAEQRQKILSSGVAAREMIPQTEKLLELNGLISTGKTAAAKKAFGDFFGVTNPDLGQFNAMAGRLVLDNIRMLGANPTEGERQFLQQITPSLNQGGAVNEALLKDMLKIQKAQVKRAKWFAQNSGKTIEEYFLETDESDFSPSSSVTAQQDTQPQDLGGGVKFLGFE